MIKRRILIFLHIIIDVNLTINKDLHEAKLVFIYEVSRVSLSVVCLENRIHSLSRNASSSIH